MASSGYDPEDVPDAPPIAPGGGNSWHIGAHYAYMGILSALYHRAMCGEGQYIDASIHEACALTTEGAIAIYLASGTVVRRHTGRHADPGQSTRIQLATQGGGWVNVTRSGSNITPARLAALVQWMDEYGLADDLKDEKYRDPQVLQDNAFHVTDVLTNFFASTAPRRSLSRGTGEGFPLGSHTFDGRDSGRWTPGGPRILCGSGTSRAGPEVYLSGSRGQSITGHPGRSPGGLL